jgi:hypothetical protein
LLHGLLLHILYFHLLFPAGGWPSWLLGGQSKKLRDVGPYSDGAAAVAAILEEGLPHREAASEETAGIADVAAKEGYTGGGTSARLLRSLLTPELERKLRQKRKVCDAAGRESKEGEAFPRVLPELKKQPGDSRSPAFEAAEMAYTSGWAALDGSHNSFPHTCLLPRGGHEAEAAALIPGTWRPRKRSWV